ncbi:hypothetical protein ACVT98_09790 [Vibrio campbellii]
MFEYLRIPVVSDKLSYLRCQSLFKKFNDHDEPGSRLKEEASYFHNKLTRLVPSESISLYVLAQGLINDDEVVLSVLWSIFCLFIAAFARYKGTKNEDGSVQWGAIVIASISFILWLYNLGGPFLLVEGFHSPKVAIMLIAAWTTLTTLYYEPKNA